MADERKIIVKHVGLDLDEAALILSLTVLFIFCYGKPDLLDALIAYLMRGAK